MNETGYRTFGLVGACVIVFSIVVSSSGTHRNIAFLKQPPPSSKPYPFGIRSFSDIGGPTT